MKKLLLLFSLSLYLYSCETVEQKSELPEHYAGTITDINDPRSQKIQSWFDAVENKNTEVIKNLMSDDAVFLNNDLVQTKEEILNMMPTIHSVFEGIKYEDVYIFTFNYDMEDWAGSFSNAWYTLSAKGANTGNDINVKGYVSFRWNEAGLVDRVYNAYDPTLLALESAATE